MSSTYAPIVVFAYNRPWHLSQMLASLHANEESSQSDLFIFCDGPKMGASADELAKIEEVRKIANAQTWCKKLQVVASVQNRGLANSIIEGVTRVCNEYGEIIVIEDDVILSKYFLAFMNDALRVYREDDHVLSIGSWNYFTEQNSKGPHFFLTMPDTIAWATWSRAWKKFQPDSVSLLDQLKKRQLVRAFNLSGQYNFLRMLEAQAAGKVSSWAIRWTAVAVLEQTLSLYPAVALSKHAGFGNDATNCFGQDFNAQLQLAGSRLQVTHQVPIYSRKAEQDWLRVERDIIGSDAVLTYPLFSEMGWKRIKQWIKKMLGRD